nr:hypothetical protein [Propionicimonas sp.]
MLLPLRFRIITELATGGAQDTAAIMQSLAPEYGRERQFTKKMIDNHLQSLRAVGLVEDVAVSLDRDGGLVRTAGITDAGRKLLKYLPRDWRRRVGAPGR